MTMWVCRTGKNSSYYEMFKHYSCVFLPWEGFEINLKSLSTIEEIKAYVAKEKATDNRITISNWAGQLYAFSNSMMCGDYILIPEEGSRFYLLAKITDEYKYKKNHDFFLYHSHDIEILAERIPRSIFAQDIIHSLGAYRTVWRIRQYERVLKSIDDFIKKLS